MGERNLTRANGGKLSDALRGVGQLIDAGRLREARAALEDSDAEPQEMLALLRLKLSVAERELEPSSALQAVVAFLRNAPGHAAAMDLYQQFSMLQYQAGLSCLSHSHPPPARSR